MILNRFTQSNVTAALKLGDWTLPMTQGREVAISTRRPAQHVSLKDAPLVFVGYGINAPGRQWNDFKGQDLHGKILVVLVNDADFEEPALNTFGGKAMTYYGRWTYKYEEAARQGAAGCQGGQPRRAGGRAPLVRPGAGPRGRCFPRGPGRAFGRRPERGR